MKKFLITAAIVLSCAVAMVPRASAQSASLSYTGVPSSVTPGSSFTIGISVVFVSGGIMNNINGYSLWLAQQSPASGFPFAITNRDITGTQFTDLQTTNPNLNFPNPLDPINRHNDGTTTQTDLGALSASGLPSGTYFLMNLTFSVSPSAVPGSYILRSTTNTTPGIGGRISIVNNSNGDTFPLAASLFNAGGITVVPEPSSIALLCVGLVSAGALAYRRRVAAR